MMKQKNINRSGVRKEPEGFFLHLFHFIRLLRKNGISVPFSSILDIFKGLSFIDISDPYQFYFLLQSTIIHDVEYMEKFYVLFTNYFLKRSSLSLPVHVMSKKTGKLYPQKTLKKEKDGVLRDSYHGYTNKPIAKEKKLSILPDTSWERYENIFELLHSLQRLHGRRYRYPLKGKDIALNRILRKNLQFGGELILLSFKKKKIKKRRLILFIDVSGSMEEEHIVINLYIAHLIKRLESKTEIFLFSTDLVRATELLNKRDIKEVLEHIHKKVIDFRGGTRIGQSLKKFNELYGKDLLSSKTIAIIFSDGLDRGEIDLLKKQMYQLWINSYKVIWINPFLGSRDYQPIYRGMKAALPFVDHFMTIRKREDISLFMKLL